MNEADFTDGDTLAIAAGLTRTVAWRARGSN